MKTIHPAIAGHAMEENEKLRGLLQKACELIEEQNLHIDAEMLPAGRSLVEGITAALSQQAEPVEPALAAVPDSSDAFYAGLYKKSAPMWHRLHDLAVSKGYDHVRFAIECAPVYKCDCMGARKVAIDMAGNTIPCECVAAANEAEQAPAQTEQQPVAFRECRVINFRPGMGEVTFYVKGGVPGFMDPGCTIYVSEAAPVAQADPLDVDTLAEIIRKVDGNHTLGAGVLAERVIAELGRLNAPQPEQNTTPMQPIELDSKGVIRFRENRIVRHLLDFATPLGCGLNELVRMEFSDEDRMQLAQLIGYSVSGYGDLSYASDGSVAVADKVAAALSAQGGQ